LPFLPLFDDVSGVASSRILKRSGFAINDDVSFGGMGGKSGKKRQGGWQKRQEVARWVAKTATFARGVAAFTLPGLRLHAGVGGVFASQYGVVKVLAARGDAVYMEPICYARGAMSSW
jgi:hypothetical protein